VRQLLRELDHRVRNNLAALVGLAQIAKREARAAGLEIGSVDRAAGRGEGASLATFESRVMAMGRIHALLSRSRWSEARL
jgi:two-component sensor histidine kinase